MAATKAGPSNATPVRTLDTSMRLRQAVGDDLREHLGVLFAELVFQHFGGVVQVDLAYRRTSGRRDRAESALGAVGRVVDVLLWVGFERPWFFELVVHPLDHVQRDRQQL